MLKYSEAKRLLRGWDKGNDKTLAASLRYHFEEHGPAVGASDVWQYLRKAEVFKQNLKGAQKARLDEGKIRYTKTGKYLIQTAGGKILSFGKVRR